MNRKDIQQYASKLAKHLEKKQKNLQIRVVCIDDSSTKKSIAQKLEHDEHKNILFNIIKKARKYAHSSCLGVSSIETSALFGFKKIQSHIALIAINTKDIDLKHDISFLVFRGIGEALRIIEHGAPTADVLVPQNLKTYDRVKHNLVTDIFAALGLLSFGYKNGFKHIAQKRAAMSLTPRTGYLPEDYPIAVAHEMLMSAYDKKPVHQNTPHKFFDIMATARQYAHMVDNTAIQKWRNFVSPAQNMLWRGYTKEQALTSAISYSEDTHTAHTGMMISDLLDVQVTSKGDMPRFYSSFSSDEQNIRKHQKSIEDIFEDVISTSHEEQSADSIFAKANEQNIRLSNGRIMGWCAAALQAAGKAFDSALKDKSQREDASNIARSTFEESHKDSNWENLRQFGEIIIKKNRLGHETSLSDIKELAQKDDRFAMFGNSIEATLQDPVYLKHLQAVNDPAPMQSFEGPKVTRKFDFSPAPTQSLDQKLDVSTPTYAPPVAMSLGLGGSGSSPRKPKFRKPRVMEVIEGDHE